MSSLRVAQWREMNVDDVQPIEEILAEPLAGNFLLKILVGRRNNTYVCIDGSRAAKALDSSVLENPQELNLDCGW
jgi:hypothetical protein